MRFCNNVHEVCSKSKDWKAQWEEFEDTKGVIRIRILKKNKQRNGQKKKIQKDKQRSAKQTYQAKDRIIRTPLKTGSELRCSGRVSSSCSTCGTRRVYLVTHPVIGHQWGRDREVLTTSGVYPWLIVTQIFHNGQPSHGGDRKTFEVMTSTYPRGTLGSRASSFAADLYQGNPDGIHKF
jgi:hypothetical protein